MRRRDMITATVLKLSGLALPCLAMAAPAGAASPVVLELFTSQGCSSCPPADALLGELIQQPGVIGLAWHVDYWNSLGWKDPYASRDRSERQRTYASRLNEEVYTPAMVVNGTAMVVGSDRPAVLGAIGRVAPASVSVTLRRTSSGLEAEFGTLPASATGLLVSYDPQMSTQVGAGENQGRRLVEYRVVRDAVALPAPALHGALNVPALNGAVSRLALPLVGENRGAVLLVQDETWRIIGAADLPPGQGA